MNKVTVNTIKRVNITGDLANVNNVNIDIDYRNGNI